MKKVKYFAMMALALGAMTACSDDDDKAVDAAAEVAGTYDGWSNASCAYFQDQIEEDQELTITRVADGKVSVQYESESFGTYKVAAATVTESNGKYLIAGEGTTEMGMGGNVKEYACTMTGTIENHQGNVTFSIPSVMGGLNVVFSTGKAPANAE